MREFFFLDFFSGIPFGIPIIGFWYPEKYSGIPGISGYRKSRTLKTHLRTPYRGAF